MNMTADTMLRDPPPATRDSYHALEREYGARNYKPFEVVLTRGLGVWVWDVDGRRYLDCLSAYSAVNRGHCHPRILAALTEQASRLAITSRASMDDQLPLFYKELCAVTHSHKVLPMNSGAEAVETAVKVARKWGYSVKGVPKDRAEVIVCANNFHGRTLTIVGFSTDPTARDGFGPFTPGFRLYPLPTSPRSKWRSRLIRSPSWSSPSRVRGDNSAHGLFQSLARFVRATTYSDSRPIQTGLGRTGRLLAEEHEGIEADLTLIGKALSGGFYPVSAVLSNDEILGVLKPGEHGSTFGGNPLACAVARAALEVLIEEGMIENAGVRGHDSFGLRRIDRPAVKEIRGRGLMIAVELHPQAGGARRYCDALRRRGVLCKDTHDHTIRVSPPLVITRSEIDWALEQFDAALAHPEAA